MQAGAKPAVTLEKIKISFGASDVDPSGGPLYTPAAIRDRPWVCCLGGNHVNRNELIDAVADKAGLQKSSANKAVEAVFESITDALKGGGEVRLVGFGTFSVASRAASEGRNPRTGEKIKIAASKQAKFKPGKRLRDELN
jgi:DNA-binding protein HU-beta